MLLKSYKNILPASVAFIGGMIFAVGQPELALANDQAGFTPTDRPKPQRTQGGGSRLHLNVVFTPSQSLLLQNPIL
ncbi:hypothetical protein APA_3546 [Pseudanabaena sp. lw0831]|uniref:hypothetical protein n=1 Tax=Pseudanabaena sp. lw0831 TaxID=1357935 RepID=UPI0019166F4F|nr:hypothetical protein [Pseudanabaena sp. lw0831]GBO55395.1 hypothetical protein APA_3546 [Pseudanabaena sp. lw0831]